MLQTDLSQWGPAALAGNLPYYITSPILEKIFDARSVLSSAVILIQREVANRITASPGSRDYGYLSVASQIYATPKYLFTVPPGAFSPPPKVDSAVVSLALQNTPDQADFLEFASRCFRQKRKTLRNNLLPFYPKEILETLPESPLRAEQLSIEKFRAIHARLTSTTHSDS